LRGDEGENVKQNALKAGYGIEPSALLNLWTMCEGIGGIEPLNM
jgi:hypothetical protein